MRVVSLVVGDKMCLKSEAESESVSKPGSGASCDSESESESGSLSWAGKCETTGMKDGLWRMGRARRMTVTTVSFSRMSGFSKSLTMSSAARVVGR